MAGEYGAGFAEAVQQGSFELLCFRLGRRRYGITVFKVEGVVKVPRMRRLPGAPPEVLGIAHLRDGTVPIVDLAAILAPHGERHSAANVILTDSDSRTLGFGIDEIEGIVRTRWSEVLKPPAGTGRGALIMGVVRDDSGLIQLPDFERIIARLTPALEPAPESAPAAPADASRVLVVDDSKLARSRVAAALGSGGWDVVTADDGAEALRWLEESDRGAPERLQTLRVVVCDVEMPGMDGYELCRRLRADERFRGLRLLLHTSLSGRFDAQSVRRSGADDFLSKFDAEVLAQRVHRLACA